MLSYIQHSKSKKKEIGELEIGHRSRRRSANSSFEEENREMGEAVKERLSQALASQIDNLHQTLHVLDQTPASSLEKLSWDEVFKMGEQLSKQATTAGMLWTREKPELKALEESMEGYFNILQGLLLLAYESTVGAGPTLSSNIHASVKHVVDSSFVLWKESVASYDLEWKLIYVGSAEDETYDQLLESVLVGPVNVGNYRFILQADPPDPSKIHEEDIIGVTVLLLTCSYTGQEFVRVGYYVNNDYGDEQLREEPPQKVLIDRVQRNILAHKPRVTKFPINFQPENEEQGEQPVPSAGHAVENDSPGEQPPPPSPDHQPE
ncbi:hypothetical protein Dimus_011525 [Dionaea muscipula]